MTYVSPSESIDWLIENGFAQDLIDALLGESDYASERSFEGLDSHLRRLRTGATEYLKIILPPKEVCPDALKASDFHDHFEAWKIAGCPGLSITLLEQLREDLILPG